jgi:hypothetical protein
MVKFSEHNMKMQYRPVVYMYCDRPLTLVFLTEYNGTVQFVCLATHSEQLFHFHLCQVGHFISKYNQFYVRKCNFILTSINHFSPEIFKL